jgi:hypothetical protein
MPLGTRIITLDGLNITLPKAPKRADILFNKYAKTDQYWRRQEVLKGLTLIHKKLLQNIF